MKQAHPNPFDERDQILSETLREALPDAPASPALRQRVAQMAAQTKTVSPKRRALTRRARFAVGAVGVALALLIFAVMWPRVLTTQAMAQIESALSNVSSARMTVYIIENGQRVTKSVTWIEGDKTRTQDSERGITTLQVGGKSWVYNAERDEVKVRTKTPASAQSAAAFTMSALMQGMTLERQKPAVTLLNDAQFEGRTVGRVQLVSRTDHETSTLIFLFDKATDLPIRGDILVRNRYGQELKGAMEFEFNQPFAPSLFAPKFSRDARFIELNEQSKTIADQLKNALAHQKVGARTIAIRDLRVNARGDVFVLYTAGKQPDDRFSDRENWFNGRDWKIYLTDSLGTRYHYPRGQGYDPQYLPGMRPIPLFDGQRLHGDWWVPDVAPQPGKRWESRTFTLQFEVNPRNLHGGDGVRVPADYSAKARFKVPVDEAQTTIVPAPMKFIGGGLSDDQILQIESEARGELPPGARPSPELQRVLIESEDTYAVQFSPDGQQILTGGDGGARLFEAQSGRLLKQWRGPQGSHADEVVVAPNGKTVGAAYTTRDYRALEFALWDATSLKQRARWKWDLGADESLASLAIAPDNRTLRVVIRHVVQKHYDSQAGEITDQMQVETQERDLFTGKIMARHIMARHILTDASFVLEIGQAQSGGKWWVATLQNEKNPRGRSLQRFDGATGARVADEDISDLDGRGLAMAAGQVAVSGRFRPRRADGSVDFEAMPQGSEVRTYAVDADKNLARLLLTGSNHGQAIALSSDGRRIAFEDDGHTISVRETQNGRTLKTLTGHYALVTHLAFSPDGKRLVSADLKGKTFAWKLN